jgi:hypothetical protein
MYFFFFSSLVESIFFLEKKEKEETKKILRKMKRNKNLMIAVFLFSVISTINCIFSWAQDIECKHK